MAKNSPPPPPPKKKKKEEEEEENLQKKGNYGTKENKSKPVEAGQAKKTFNQFCSKAYPERLD